MSVRRDVCDRTPALRRTRLISAEPADAAISDAASTIAQGALAALPTETVYGLCAAARSDDAVARLYAAKGRPSSNPLIVHVADADAACAIAAIGPLGAVLAERLWPGPLTLVAPLRPEARIAPAATAFGWTVAVRVPAAPIMRAVAARAGPIVAPSANRSGRVSATTAEAVCAELWDRIDLVVDAGPSPLGLESTVVDVTEGPAILRPGAIPAETIAALVGPLAGQAAEDEGGSANAAPSPLRAPGLLASHYAPSARLRLDVPSDAVGADEAWLALGDAASRAPETRTYRLSRTGDLAEAARHLYAGLRALDATGADVIAVSPIAREGIGAAIRDRLARAAAPRPEHAETA